MFSVRTVYKVCYEMESFGRWRIDFRGSSVLVITAQPGVNIALFIPSLYPL